MTWGKVMAAEPQLRTEGEKQSALSVFILETGLVDWVWGKGQREEKEKSRCLQ